MSTNQISNSENEVDNNDKIIRRKGKKKLRISFFLLLSR